jgi:hypothetical protein
MSAEIGHNMPVFAPVCFGSWEAGLSFWYQQNLVTSFSALIGLYSHTSNI